MSAPAPNSTPSLNMPAPRNNQAIEVGNRVHLKDDLHLPRPTSYLVIAARGPITDRGIPIADRIRIGWRELFLKADDDPEARWRESKDCVLQITPVAPKQPRVTKCAICHTDYCSENMVLILVVPCGHLLHKACADSAWANAGRNPPCLECKAPICRWAISK